MQFITFIEHSRIVAQMLIWETCAKVCIVYASDRRAWLQTKLKRIHTPFSVRIDNKSRSLFDQPNNNKYSVSWFFLLEFS